MIAVLVVVAVILVVLFMLRRRRMLKNPPSATKKPNVRGYDNKGLKTDEEWELEQKSRQLGPAIVEQDVKPKNTTTLARPRKDVPPEHVNRPQKRYSSAYRQSGESPPRHSTTSQNGVTPPKGVSPGSANSANGAVPIPQIPSAHATHNGNTAANNAKFQDVDLS